jgi:hypothetical protein
MAREGDEEEGVELSHPPRTLPRSPSARSVRVAPHIAPTLFPSLPALPLGSGEVDAGDAEAGMEAVDAYPSSDPRGFHPPLLSLFGVHPPRPVTWKATFIIWACDILIILPLGGTGTWRAGGWEG